MRMILFSNVKKLLGLTFLLSAMPSLAEAQSPPPEPIVDWQKKQDATGPLEALGVGLLGDKIEPHTGALAFEHTDVALPGNSSLDVSIRRRIKTGGLYKSNVKSEFGDWELIVPRIKVTTSSLSDYRTGNRCSAINPLQMVQVPYPEVVSNSSASSTIQRNRDTYSNEYSNGYILDVPGYGAQTMLKHRPSSPALYTSAEFVTTSGWKIDCLSGITGGGEGYEATAPNGTVYRFDRFYELEAPRLGFHGHTDSAFDRYVSIVAATRVTDIHGNTVDYTYDTYNRLTKIEASDDRKITLIYDETGTDMISRVTANGRHWDYDYGTNSLNYTARFEVNTGYPQSNIKDVGPYPTLTTVTRPDNLSWTLDMEAMSAEVPPALSCEAEIFTVTVTHPHGTEGKFIFSPMQHKVTGTSLSPKPNNVMPSYCPNPEVNSANGRAGAGDPPVSQYHAPVWMMSTESKILSATGIPTSTWSYHYELNENPAGPNNDQLNWTKVTNPNGTVEKFYHGWGTELITGNQLVKKQILDGSSVLREDNYTNTWETSFGWDGLSGGSLDFFAERPRHTTKVTTTQDGDIFTTESAYSHDRSSTSYSFGKPTQTQSYSNITLGYSNNPKRITDTT